MSYVVRVEKDKVKIYKSNGTYIRTIYPGGSVSSAVISGDEVHITMSDGKIKIYGINGSYKKTIY